VRLRRCRHEARFLILDRLGGALDGWAWTSAARAIRNVFTVANANRENVAAVGLTGAMVGVWPIDAKGRPVRQAVHVSDTRGPEALRGSEKISEDTRSRIAHLAHKHGYVYNRQAADLRTQTSRAAAVCLHTIGSSPEFLQQSSGFFGRAAGP
jgi:hypothetical protein